MRVNAPHLLRRWECLLRHEHRLIQRGELFGHKLVHGLRHWRVSSKLVDAQPLEPKHPPLSVRLIIHLCNMIPPSVGVELGQADRLSCAVSCDRA